MLALCGVTPEPPFTVNLSLPRLFQALQAEIQALNSAVPANIRKSVYYGKGQSPLKKARVNTMKRITQGIQEPIIPLIAFGQKEGKRLDLVVGFIFSYFAPAYYPFINWLCISSRTDVRHRCGR